MVVVVQVIKTPSLTQPHKNRTKESKVQPSTTWADWLPSFFGLEPCKSGTLQLVWHQHWFIQITVLSAFFGDDQAATEAKFAADPEFAPWVKKYQDSRETISQTDYEVRAVFYTPP